MKLMRYTGNIWASKFKEYDPELLALLKSSDVLIVLSNGKPPYKVVFGVPHQAAVGEEYICENTKKRESDENVASLALVAFSLLKEHDIPCKLIIAAHSTQEDPNNFRVLAIPPLCSFRNFPKANKALSIVLRSNDVSSLSFVT